MTVELLFSVASFIVMLVVLYCVIKIYLVPTVCCNLRANHPLEGAATEEQLRANREPTEPIEPGANRDRRINIMNRNVGGHRPRGFVRRRRPEQHDERLCWVRNKITFLFYSRISFIEERPSSLSWADIMMKLWWLWRYYRGHYTWCIEEPGEEETVKFDNFFEPRKVIKIVSRVRIGVHADSSSLRTQTNSWLPITRTLANSNLALTRTKIDFPWISSIHSL